MRSSVKIFVSVGGLSTSADFNWCNSIVSLSMLFSLSHRLLHHRPVFYCGGDLVGDTGFVGSEGFPSFYKPNSKCTWRITVSHLSRKKSKYWLLPHSLLWMSDSCTISRVPRFQREMWSCSPSAFLTWKLTHNVATTIWMFTTAIPTWCKN